MTKEITLQHGLDNFHKKNSKYFSDRLTSEKTNEFFLHHDVAHVLFGCDTTIYGEGVLKTWTTFGTTLGFWKMITEYNEANAFELFRMYSFRHVVNNIFRLLMVIPLTIVRARKMSKPWPWSNYNLYLNKPISEIRKEFGIIILKESI
jgi:ubiquinone biosynthesis protein Coq4